MRYAYFHGFGSGPQSYKGMWLADAFSAHGIELELPDLNQPSRQELTITEVLEHWTQCANADPGPYCLIGSSFGGYLAARWAELNPQHVHKLFLLCPGFDLKQRWTEILGAAAIEEWRQNGHHDFEEPNGNALTVHWGLFSDLDNHPPYPEISCPTLIVHGRDDALIPSRLSVEYALGHKHIRCEVVSGDHHLHGAVDRIRDEAFRHFSVPAKEG